MKQLIQKSVISVQLLISLYQELIKDLEFINQRFNIYYNLKRIDKLNLKEECQKLLSLIIARFRYQRIVNRNYYAYIKELKIEYN